VSDAGWKVTSGLLGALVLLVGLIWNTQDTRIDEAIARGMHEWGNYERKLDKLDARVDELERLVITYRAGREAIEALERQR